MEDVEDYVVYEKPSLKNLTEKSNVGELVFVGIKNLNKKDNSSCMPMFLEKEDVELKFN